MTGTFQQLDEIYCEPSARNKFRCHLCQKREIEEDRSAVSTLLKDRTIVGLSVNGETIHCWDMAMLRTDSGPCDIVQIVSFSERPGEQDIRLEIKKFGRMNREDKVDANEVGTLFIIHESVSCTALGSAPASVRSPRRCCGVPHTTEMLRRSSDIPKEPL